MHAIANAQGARDHIVARLLETARERWPDEWHDLAPLPFRFASWVGYDMDGRTDIKWFHSIGFRLSEKAERLQRYLAELEAIDAAHPLLGELRPAADFAAERAADFAADLSDPAALSLAANRLTASDPRKCLSLAPFIDKLEAEARSAEPDRAVALKTLAAAMRADGLGMGWIHFRVNAKQLHNAIRRRLDPKGEIDLASKGAIVHLRRAIAKVKPLRTNFAALAIESSTAIRQFLAMAQIVQHIDGDAPIRMLVAECEEPATMLAALYFAKLFGIDGQVDISPLFETESALEHGGRFLDELLAEDALPGLRQGARARGDPDRVFRRRALRRADSRKPRHRTPAGAAGRSDGGERADRCRRTDLRHPRRNRWAAGRTRAACATGSNGRCRLGPGVALPAPISGSNQKSASRAATVTCGSPPPNSRLPR